MLDVVRIVLLFMENTNGLDKRPIIIAVYFSVIESYWYAKMICNEQIAHISVICSIIVSSSLSRHNMRNSYILSLW